MYTAQPWIVAGMMPSKSWIRSREATLWHHLAPTEARAVLVKAYDEGAAAEALLRAFLAERDSNRELARFWVAVYDFIVIAPKIDSVGKP